MANPPSDSPRRAALLACEAEPVPPSRSLALEGRGRALVIGEGEEALEAARRLSARAGVAALLSRPPEPLPDDGFPVHSGSPSSVQGRFGAFRVQVPGPAPAAAPGEAGPPSPAGSVIETDAILDLSRSAPLLAAPHLRDGYVRADPRRPGAVDEAVDEVAALEGTFEKPLYVEVRGDRCAHSRSRRTGCTRCLDTCPPSALAPEGDHVALDPYVCAGCGSCASVCPTGALRIDHPAEEAVLRQVRALLRAFLEAGGEAPLLVLHGEGFARQLLEALEEGGGLPPNALPLPLGEATRAGAELLWIALAYGAAGVVCVLDPARADEAATLRASVDLANALTEGLGMGARVSVFDEADPDALREALGAPPAAGGAPAAGFLPLGERREVARQALRHLHAHAGDPPDEIPLPAGAPYGEVRASDACTLCLACVGACPTGALQDDPDTPRLGFLEDACVQCGICRSTCPEGAVTLHPRLSFGEGARAPRTLREEEPFACVSCGKPFGVRRSIERTIERLAGHAMLAADPRMAQRLRMCADCRVVDQFREEGTDLPPRPRVRTSDDYRAKGVSGAPGDGRGEK